MLNKTIMETYDRYKMVRKNGTIGILPIFTIKKKESDFYETYNNSNRLDILSNKYYGNPNYDWLILAANPEYGSMEFDIPDNTLIRIPYPLNSTLSEIDEKISEKIF